MDNSSAVRMECLPSNGQPVYSHLVKMKVAVIGTGNFGTALTSRMIQAGLDVVVGSRSINGSDASLGSMVTVPVAKALQENLVILAVPPFSHSSLQGKEKMTAGTVVVDCSNRLERLREGEMSQAELLQQYLPDGVHVVKALNTVSAHLLEQGPEEVNGKMVPVASDSEEAKDIVGKLLVKLGFTMVDFGGLQGARQIEQIPLSLFPKWKAPLLVSTIIWFVIYILSFARYHFCEDGRLGWYGDSLEDMPLKYVNKTSDSHALVLLAACYLPGVLAAYIQLIRGTKYSSFPNWLDQWLKMRKELGLLMLLSATIHMFMYCLVWSPHEVMDWHTSLLVCFGILGYCAAVILGITSLPSVASSMSWREFRTIQSWLGWLCLLLSTLHVIADGWFKIFTWRRCIFLSCNQLPLILPVLTILLKLPLLIPMLDWRLTSIRQGKEFGNKRRSDNMELNGTSWNEKVVQGI